MDNKTTMNLSSIHEEQDIRDELPWEEREEEQVHVWRQQSTELSRQHGLNSKRHKKMHRCISVPSILIPIIGGSLGSLPIVPAEVQLYMNAGLLLVTGVLVALNTFFNFAKKHTQHSEYENRYLELVDVIDREMVKPKRFRPPCDVFLEAVSRQMARLKAGAPDL